MIEWPDPDQAVEQGATLPQIQTPPSRSATGTCAPSGVASAIALGV
jgi:hypothetical protein